MKRRFNFLTFLTTLILALPAALIWIWLAGEPVESAAGNIIIGGGFFALSLILGCIGMELGLRLRRKKYRVSGRRSMISSLLLALVLGIGIGGITQTVYALDYLPRTKTSDIDTRFDGAHVVLLFDGSGSMSENLDTCDEASCLLIDSFDENTSLQVIAFAKKVLTHNVSKFLPMTAENKTFIKNFVHNLKLSGGTEFNEPLRMALETLSSHKDDDHIQVILMLTDGEAPLDSDVVQTFSDPDNQVYLFTVRIIDSRSVSYYAQALIDLATQDFPIKRKIDGSVNVNDVLDAFQSALSSVTTITEEYTELGFGDDFFTQGGDEAYWWRILARVVGFALFFAASAFVYYGSVGKVQLLLHLLLGACTGAVMFVSIPIALLMYVILGLCAFTALEGVQQDVR